ncbi:MAG: hypothetical protein JWQ35_394 [Bacteriovoracaceae bacterium]|nr:hypothetical protein [Bacteriovoracaceae bacterium]
MQFKIGFVFCIFTITSLFAFEAPWKNSAELTSPWTSTDRKENREGFFNTLNQGEKTSTVAPKAEAVAEIEPPSTKEITPVANESESKADLTRIPWSAHRTIYPSDKFSSKLLWPIEGGRLTSGYGIRGGNFHEGLDIAAPEGAWVRAAAPGRVVYNGNLHGYGHVMVIYHGDGMASVYAHNSENLKRRGAVIQKGEVIAKVGHTGHANGNHCHFEIRKDGKPMNPLLFTFSKTPVLAQR